MNTTNPRRLSHSKPNTGPLALLLAFILLIPPLIFTFASAQTEEGGTPSGMPTDMPTIASPDNGKILCPLDAAELLIKNPAATVDWDIALVIGDGDDLWVEEHTFTSSTGVVTIDRQVKGTRLFFFLSEIGEEAGWETDWEEGSILLNAYLRAMDLDQIVEIKWGSDSIENAALSYTADPTDPLTVEFTAAADLHIHEGFPCAGSLTYAWTFGDGASTTTNIPTVQHTYPSNPGGRYDATVTITGANGGSATASKMILADYPIRGPEEICQQEGFSIYITNKNEVVDNWSAKYQILANGTVYGPYDAPSLSGRTAKIDIAALSALPIALFTNHTSDAGTSKTITIELIEIDGVSVSSEGYSISVNVVYWLQSINHIIIHQLLDDPYKFQFTPHIVTHCDSDSITEYKWTSLGCTFMDNTVRDPYIISNIPSYKLSGTKLEIKTAGGIMYVTGAVSQGSASVGFTGGGNPIPVLSNSTICRYETPQLSVTNTEFESGTPWFFTLLYDGVEHEYSDIMEKTTVISIDFLGDNPALGQHVLTITKLNGNPTDAGGSTVPTATITVVKPVSADFWFAVTPGSLDVDFVAAVDLHSPTTGGPACAGVGEHENNKMYEWIFDTGFAPFDVRDSLLAQNTYPSPGEKTVTLNVYDKRGEIADSVTKNLTLTGGGAVTSKFDVTYSSGSSSGVTNMPDNDTGVDKDSTYTISSKVPVRYGYTLRGWLSSADGQTYPAEGTFTMPERNVILSAQWEKDTDEGEPKPPEPKPSEPTPEPKPEPQPEPEPKPEPEPRPEPKPEPKPEPGPEPSSPPGRVERNEDGSYDLIGDDGVPLGRYTLADDGVTWIFEPYVPMGNLPQTGTVASPDVSPVVFLLMLGLTSLIAGLLLKSRRKVA